MRFLTFASIFLLLSLALIPSFASAAIKHGCASEIPPTVPSPLVQPQAMPGILLINEALLSPHSKWNCSQAGAYTETNDTWIEIYNPQNQPFDLYSARTTLDNGPNTNISYLPFGAAIGPHSFLVVFPYLNSYALATQTSTWRLLIGGIPVDEISIPLLGEDQSYARVPDGSSTWVITNTPTIDASNTSSTISLTATRTKAEATATARATSRKLKVSRSKGNSGNFYGNGNSTYTGNGQQIDGVQPVWGSLKHPDVIAATPSANTPSSNIAVSVSNNALDIPHKILLTLLVTALATALFWCWRLFRAP